MCGSIENIKTKKNNILIETIVRGTSVACLFSELKWPEHLIEISVLTKGNTN